jgi:hypothetical protein
VCPARQTFFKTTPSRARKISVLEAMVHLVFAFPDYRSYHTTLTRAGKVAFSPQQSAKAHGARRAAGVTANCAGEAPAAIGARQPAERWLRENANNERKLPSRAGVELCSMLSNQIQWPVDVETSNRCATACGRMLRRAGLLDDVAEPCDVRCSANGLDVMLHWNAERQRIPIR